MKTIKYCCKNKCMGSIGIYKAVKKQYPDLKQKKKKCLGSCKMCERKCFLKVGKTSLICGSSPDIVYEKLIALIDSQREEAEAGTVLT